LCTVYRIYRLSIDVSILFINTFLTRIVVYPEQILGEKYACDIIT